MQQVQSGWHNKQQRLRELTQAARAARMGEGSRCGHRFHKAIVNQVHDRACAIHNVHHGAPELVLRKSANSPQQEYA